MDYTQLGNTGLTVSVAGLGSGGNSRLGLGRGKSETEAIDLVRAALDLGVTFFDTAEVYGTEHILGRSFSPAERSKVVITTKSRILRDGQRMAIGDIIANLDTSLRRLNTDWVDVFLLHGVAPRDYDWAREEILPALLAEQKKGKVRHLGLSETAPNDHEQTMLKRALAEPNWRVMMIAYHMLNQGARRDLFPSTQAQGVGTLMMFVVRNIFSRPGVLAETLRAVAAEGKVPAQAAVDNPLDFLIHPGGASSLTDAAYRFVRHEPGADVVLFGTGDIGHLKANIASILAPPLPADDVARLYEMFGHLRGVGLDSPDNAKPLV